MGRQGKMDNLVSVERSIHIYHKRNNKLKEEINISTISLGQLLTFIKPKDGDPLLYDQYELDQNQMEQLKKLLKHPITVDFNLFNYVLICLGVYNWK
jgi:hypothetical protein